MSTAATGSSPLSPEQWAELRRLFEQALALPPEQRAALADQAGLDAAVRGELLSLLAQQTDAGAGRLLLDPLLPAQAPGGRPGLRLGGWALTELLGLGGMGEVWAARRVDGRFEGEAAIKLLRQGLDGAAVQRRFAQEQQALARLHHPHIAQLFDAGLSEDGRPYFVMERIQGQPLDQAARSLPLRERVGLMLQLCEAVAHAHGQLLVHRDLKPGNALVDREGRVKLLDFGIAKALDPLEMRLEAGAEPLTLNGQRPFTPAYASPEQVRGEPVSTATDIYSLGVLLYQLLAGLSPYGREATTPAEQARAVLDEQPQPPSLVAQRPELRGDLDNIVMKALEKEPARRYPTVQALHDDLRAWLDGLPVSARAQDWRYVLGKLMRRHRAAVAALVVGLFGLLAGGSAAAWQWRETLHARELAESRLAAVKQFNRGVVRRMGQALSNLPGGMQAKEAMLRDTLDSLETLVAQAESDLDLLGDLAIVYESIAEIQGNDTGLSLGKGREAERNASRAIDYARRAWPAKQGDLEFIQSYANMHIIRALQARADGRMDDALGLARQSEDILQTGLKRFPKERELQGPLAQTWLYIGQFHDASGRPSLNKPAVALEWFQRASAAFEAMEAEQHHREIVHELGTLAGARSRSLVNLGRLDEAYEFEQKAVANHEAELREESHNLGARSSLAVELSHLAFTAWRRGDASAAEASSRRSLALLDSIIQTEGPQSKWVQTRKLLGAHLGRALLAQGKPEAAVQPLEIALAASPQPDAGKAAPAMWKSVLLRRSWLTADLAGALAQTGQPARALALGREQLALLQDFVQRQPQDRDARVVLSRLTGSLAELPGAEAGWRGEACAGLRQAARTQALARDEQRLATRVCGGA
ncbi:serine/threonine-protein kinase [Pelomonas sp. SE-A7]|uniref:serine/threonine-protein kinase n=1 Tax=Pelomonas sp. SE-A7 TaxID=3054953 RepID=UPI00259C92EE|nr:serine/threonine-protein kinase [Pelomonas sp. SE-A7]MDM4767636.1 protein kinase [Pelomonas sp. SE-A7]